MNKQILESMETVAQELYNQIVYCSNTDLVEEYNKYYMAIQSLKAEMLLDGE